MFLKELILSIGVFRLGIQKLIWPGRETLFLQRSSGGVHRGVQNHQLIFTVPEHHRLRENRTMQKKACFSDEAVAVLRLFPI
ncbi:hypothetical protein GUJ93_ZPchr0178g7183 [Zizania palustris]|uniref:Uncharacterized protein n=1 Tax=Zizania palustris TaxID=103762 RepID=A0A8J5V265_ZIZPA|nr:hypothetical protein GUJ93_ZPchr0001g30037 [Zizania palustris]KAG8081541.1 hypothetical protein GUJ93_ZPchr0178g7183 [Zizania palustris]